MQTEHRLSSSIRADDRDALAALFAEDDPCRQFIGRPRAVCMPSDQAVQRGDTKPEIERVIAHSPSKSDENVACFTSSFNLSAPIVSVNQTLPKEL
jgi:hypothetical protein